MESDIRRYIDNFIEMNTNGTIMFTWIKKLVLNNVNEK